MTVYALKAVQVLPVSLDKAWDFYSHPENLATITPPQLDFRVISNHLEERIYAGQVIEYTIRPLLGIPLYWMTEITHVQEKKFFVDEQRFGPYSFWHHQHHFRMVEAGVEMTDIVHYKNPLWLLGSLANKLFVRKELQRIFEYRFRKAEELLGTVEQEMKIAFRRR